MYHEHNHVLYWLIKGETNIDVDTVFILTSHSEYGDWVPSVNGKVSLRENRLENEADRIKERREQFCKGRAKSKDKRAAAAFVFQLSTSCLINYMSLLITTAKKKGKG